MLDSLCAFSEHGVGAVLTEDHQSALNLAHRLLDRGQGGLTRVVAEVGVQSSFDGAEIGANFARDRFQKESFLGSARHGVEMRQFHHAELFAATERGKTTDHGIGRVCEVGIQGLEVFQCGFGQQQCCGHLQCHDIVVARRIAAQLIGLLENGRRQPRVVGLTCCGPFLGDLCCAFVKGRQCRRGTCTKVVPVVLGRCQQFAQTANMWQQPFGLGRRRRGHHPIQPVGGANDCQRLATRRGAGRKI